MIPGFHRRKKFTDLTEQEVDAIVNEAERLESDGQRSPFGTTEDA